jgi:hypothetical protein
MTIENSQELRDALFHAICLLNHANPENDTDHRDVAAARELAKLRDRLNSEAYAPVLEVPAVNPLEAESGEMKTVFLPGSMTRVRARHEDDLPGPDFVSV